MKNLFVLFFSLLAITVLGQRSGTVMTSYNNSSAVASTTVTENSLPSIQITSPSDGDTLTIDTSFTASVTATDSDGTIDSVVFFINDTRQAVDVSSPYTYNLPTESVINRELKAVAYDNDLGSAVDSINYYINDTTAVKSIAIDRTLPDTLNQGDVQYLSYTSNFTPDGVFVFQDGEYSSFTDSVILSTNTIGFSQVFIGGYVGSDSTFSQTINYQVLDTTTESVPKHFLNFTFSGASNAPEPKWNNLDDDAIRAGDVFAPINTEQGIQTDDTLKCTSYSAGGNWYTLPSGAVYITSIDSAVSGRGWACNADNCFTLRLSGLSANTDYVIDFYFTQGSFGGGNVDMVVNDSSWNFTGLQGTDTVVTATATSDANGYLDFSPSKGTEGPIYWAGMAYRRDGLYQAPSNAPSIDITNPIAEDTLDINTTETFVADVFDEGTIDSVRWFVSGSYVATDLTSPYQYNYSTGATAVTDSVYAIAYDNDGESTTSSTITFYVADVLIPATIAITDPANNPVRDSGFVVTVTVQVTENDQTVDTLFYYANGAIVDTTLNPDTVGTIGPIQENLTLYVVATRNGASNLNSQTELVTYNDTSGVSGVISLAGDTIQENMPAGRFIGTLSGGSNYYLNIHEKDNWMFRVSNDTLYSNNSFNREAYIGSNLRNSHPVVRVQDQSGAAKDFTVTILENETFDSDGYATSDMVAYYEALGDSSLRVGDYVMFNWSSRSGDRFLPTGLNVDYPNQIKIMGGYYTRVQLSLYAGVHGNNTNEQVIVTNWLGQVRCQENYTFGKCNANRITGKYDPVLKTGNRHYQGNVHDEYQHFEFGFLRDMRWQSIRSAVNVKGAGMTKIEIDHFALTGGGYDGINFKEDNAAGTVDSVYIHDIFMFEIAGEGLYIGNTKAVPAQQEFSNVSITNLKVVRSAYEGYQFQRGIGNNNNVYHNFIWSGVNALDPFQFNQYGNQQMAWGDGGHIHTKEIFMGATENHVLLKPRGQDSEVYNGDTNYVRNNLYFGAGGETGIYGNLNVPDNPSGFPPTVLDSLYFVEGFALNGSRGSVVINNFPNFPINVLVFEAWPSPIVARNIFWDSTSYEQIGNVTMESHTPTDTLTYPSFENPMDTVSVEPWKWFRWKRIKFENTSYATPQNYKVNEFWQPVVGDVARHNITVEDPWLDNSKDNRYYRCIQAHSAENIEPGVTSGWEQYWQLLTWERADGSLSYYPPDDWSITPSSYYGGLNLGLRNHNIEPFTKP